MADKKNHQSALIAPMQQLNVRIVLDQPADDTSAYYSNYAEVVSTQHEFAIFFAKIPAKLSAARTEEASKSGSLIIEPDVQIIIAPTLVPGLIKALTIAKEGFEKNFGSIKETV